MADILKFSMTLAGFAAAYGLAAYLVRARGFQFLATRRNRNTALDGLRGYLALSVFFHHLVVTWHWKSLGVWASSPDVYFLNYGKVGVFIFFMITGYLFVGKLLRAGPGQVDWPRLYESRLFRIFPLYLFALVIISLVVWAASDFQQQVSTARLIKDYLKWLVFHGASINGFAETKTIIAEVDWTLKYEWLFYLMLPMLALAFRWRYGALMLLAACVLLFITPVQVKQFNSVYLLLFGVGGVAAWARRRFPVNMSALQSTPAAVFAIGCFLAAIFYPKTLSAGHVLLISCFFVVVVAGNDLFGLLSARASVLLGEISYSIYLLHGIVLYLLFTAMPVVDISRFSLEEFLLAAPLLSVVVVGIAAVTFLLIERPCMALGKQYRLSRLISTLRKNLPGQGSALATDRAAPGYPH